MQSLAPRHLVYSVRPVLYALTLRMSLQAPSPSPVSSIVFEANRFQNGASMQLRTNMFWAQAIENGLVVDEVNGSAAAWAYLADHGVPTPVILRVLVSPARRRQTDPIYSTSEQ